MTKKDIRDKYNIVCLERPERANKELSNGEAKKYEKNQKLLMKISQNIGRMMILEKLIKVTLAKMVDKR